MIKELKKKKSVVSDSTDIEEEEYEFNPIEAKPKASTSFLDTVLQKSVGTNNELASILKDLRDELEEIRK